MALGRIHSLLHHPASMDLFNGSFSNMQLTLVIVILAVTLGLTIWHYYRRFTGKVTGCDSCPHGGGECHCKDNCTLNSKQ